MHASVQAWSTKHKSNPLDVRLAGCVALDPLSFSPKTSFFGLRDVRTGRQIQRSAMCEKRCSPTFHFERRAAICTLCFRCSHLSQPMIVEDDIPEQRWIRTNGSRVVFCPTAS